MPGFEPQTAVRLAVVPCDAALEQTPTAVELTLLAVPDGANIRLELLSVSFTAHTLPIDATHDVHCDLEWIDDSDGDAVANLLAAFDLEDDTTAAVVTQVWRGSQVLDPGDAVNVEFDVTTPDTAAEGAAFIVEYKVLRRSG